MTLIVQGVINIYIKYLWSLHTLHKKEITQKRIFYKL